MLEFELTQNPETLIEVFQVVPNLLREMTLNQVCRQSIFVGNQPVELGDVFSVSGDPADLHHVWRGNLSMVGGIGHEISEGRIQVDGHAGNHVGSRMTGGMIHVSGNTGNHVGAEMTGGLIHIKGDAGSSVGAAYDGGQTGQNGGAILIDGSAGHLVGKSMRRGLIAVGGDVKNCCGFLMKAGTIVVFGQAGKNVGLEMTRGTIVLLNEPRKSPAGFVTAGPHPMLVTRLINRHLIDLGFSRALDQSRFQVWHGDALRGGRGELLIAI